MIRLRPIFPLFPYTTLFRSRHAIERIASSSRVVVPGLAPCRYNQCTSTAGGASRCTRSSRSEEHTSELQSRGQLVCRLLLEKKNMIHSSLYMDRIRHTIESV